MKAFTYRKAHHLKDLTKGAPASDAGKFLAGGTTLIDLMKLEVETPASLTDINALPLNAIEVVKGGAVRIGAMVRNSDLAHDARIKRDFAVLSEALLAGASAQLRNKATTGGNLLQRTRCVYFRDVAQACNKRHPGSGCAAIAGFNRNLAILGTSSACIATNPSDMNVALMALEARVELQPAGGGAKQEVDIDKFYLLPGDTPHREFALAPHDLITAVTVPAIPPGAKSLYLKVRDRASYEFALASVAVIAKVEGGVFRHVRLALGGVGTKPWRARDAEVALEGKPLNEQTLAAAAELAVRDAKPQSENGFKVALIKKCMVYALRKVSEA